MRSQINPTSFRDTRNLVLARLSDLASPLLGMAARIAVRSPPTAPSSWRRGILIGADHIGDVLYNTASLPVLSAAFPRCEWHYVAAGSAAAVLANNPAVASCISKADMLESVDVAICYNSGAYWRSFFEVVRLGIPNRIGYVHKGFSRLVTDGVRINYPQPFPAYFRDLVSQLTHRSPDWSLRPKVYPSPADEDEATALWQRLGLERARPVIPCFATSRQASGVWPLPQFGLALRQVEREPQIQTILMGAPEDFSTLSGLKNQFGLRAVVVAGEIGLLALVAFLGRCTAVFSTDSGPRHLANAAGVRVVYLRNISFSKVEAGRYCDTEMDLAPDVEFVPASEQGRVFSRIDPVEVGNQVVAFSRSAAT